MDGYVWRVPTLFGVMACSALVLFAAGVLRSIITRRRPSTLCKLGTGSVLILLAVLAAIAVRATAALIARSQEISLMYVEPSPVGYLAPLAFAAFAFAVGQRMLRQRWTGGRAALFYGWLLGFTAANIVNRCSPGWCATVGFPFTWYAWSDAMLTFADERLGHFIDFIDTARKVAGAVLNLITFVAVGWVLTRMRFRPLKAA